MEAITDEVLRRMHNRPVKDRPFIVALDGLSGAGKTTLVQKLEQEFHKHGCKVTIFHIDDHIVERKKRYDTGYEEWYEYYSLQWDVEWLRENLFERLHNNVGEITLPFYYKTSDTYSTNRIAIETDSIVLIEGIFLQRKEWRHYCDFVIYLDVTREKRYERVRNRDTYIGDEQEIVGKYNRRYWPGEDYYLKTENPLEQADMIWRT